jgi:hypothetical protein
MLVRSLAFSLNLIKPDKRLKWEEAHHTPTQLAAFIQNLSDSGINYQNNNGVDSILIAHANLFKEKIIELSNNNSALPSAQRDIWDKVSIDWLNESILDSLALRKK